MADYLEKNDYPAWLEPSSDFYENEGFSYKDYEKWGDDVKVELIDGIVYMMSSPGERHQWIVSEFHGQLWNELKDKKCQVYSDLDVRLFYHENKLDKTVVRPDVMVVCDEKKVLGKKTCEGAPDFIIEVLSAGTAGKDFFEKKMQYEKAGVKEYWIVGKDKVYQYVLVDGSYFERFVHITKDLKLPVGVLGGCLIDFSRIMARYGQHEK